MKNVEVTYIEDPNFKMPRKFLPDKIFAEAMESFVIVDADVVFVTKGDRSTLLLARRKAKPVQGGLWFVGGRIYAGESELEGIVRLVKRETGLEIAPERFEYLRMQRYMWNNRQQEPQDKGSDNLCYMFALEITPDEREQASQQLDPNEYESEDGLREYSKEMLEKEGVHQAVLDLFNLI